MPSPNRNQYFNKESVKFNAALQVCFDHQVQKNICSPVMNLHPLSTGLALVNYPTLPEAESLIQKLLHPPPHAFPHGILSIQWVIGAVGMEHLVLRETDGRYVVRSGSILEDMAARGRLPAIYWEWLCGGEESGSGATAAEIEVCLTKEYFAELEIERWWEEVEPEMEEDFDIGRNEDGATDNLQT